MNRLFLLAALICVTVPPLAMASDTCLDCHGQKGARGFIENKILQDSSHGFLPCAKCHINISPYPHGPVAKVNCGICHFLGNDGAPTAKAREYKMSVHNRITPLGDNKAPTCQTCHGSHAIYPSGDKRSATRRQNIPALCSQCHPKEAEAYGKSVHGIEALDKNNAQAPTCFDCHLEHLVPPAGNAQWMLSLIKECGNCHQEQMATYWKTYHGKVTRLGYASMAKCSDCHGSHGIVRVAEQNSPLSEQNILSTCRKCHPKATIGFTKFYAHPDETNREKYPLMFYTFVFMTALLIGTFTFFFLHTFLWAYRALKERIEKKGGG